MDQELYTERDGGQLADATTYAPGGRCWHHTLKMAAMTSFYAKSVAIWWCKVIIGDRVKRLASRFA